MRKPALARDGAISIGPSGKSSFKRIIIMNLIRALDDTEVQALKDTLDDEYKSRETYAQVIRDFGEVRPFINIVDAEARHVNALLNLFKKYGVAPLTNRWAGKTPRFSSVHEACVASVQGEIENVAIYDRALKSTRRSDILAVYQALQSASQDRHLPAFQRCAQRSLGGRS
jgi:hypothetical protein